MSPPTPSRYLVPMGDGWRLTLVSFLLLFLELALIRWTSAHIVHLGYFANFALLGCFLGIGLGLLLARRERPDLMVAFPWIVCGTVVLVLLFEVQAVVDSPSEIHFTALSSVGFQLPMEALLPAVFVLVAAAHVGPAQAMGRLLRGARPLHAYSLNVLGSLAGIAAFSACSLLGLGASVWFLALAVLYALTAPAVRSWSPLVLLVPTVLCSITDVDAVWSPYYRIQVNEKPFPGIHRPLRRLEVNRVEHQFIGDVRDREPFYSFPYEALGRRDRPPEVLIIGAGTGTDTTFGLLHGAARIDAVEIDPEILRLGTEMNEYRPYADPRVTTFATDGRVFMKNSDRKYDLVIFGLPDSLSLVSNMSSVRLESFLFTEESFEEARGLLKDDGMFVMYNYYRQEWLVRRLADMLGRVYGGPPVVRVEPSRNMTAILFAGPAAAGIPASLGADWGFRPLDLSNPAEVIDLPTDDWPFLYLREPGIPFHYVVCLAAILVFATLSVAFAGRGLFAGGLGRAPWHLFCTGAAFMLLETSSVVRASLLLGSTWITNAFVFLAILLLVLLANLLVIRLKPRRLWPLALALAASLAVAWLVPLDAMLGLPPGVRVAAAGALMLSPVFFANILFARFFSEEEGTADLGLAVNLLGAILGGVLEYVSMAAGFGFLYLLAALLYTAAIVAWASRRGRVSIPSGPFPPSE